MRRRFALLILLVLVVAGGWTGFWFYAAGEVERRLDIAIAELAGRGTEIACAERDVSGYPFRMEVRCAGVSAQLADGSQVSGGAVRAVALVYNPRHIIVEADAPLAARLAPAGLDLAGEWTRGRSSLRFDNGAVAATAVSVSDLQAAVSGGFGTENVAAELVELHLRPTPGIPQSADVAISLSGLALRGPLAVAEPFDAGALLQVPRGGAIIAGEAVPASLVGTPITIREAFLARGGARLSAHGTLTLGVDGYLSGSLEVTAVDPQQVAELLAPFYPQGSAIPGAFEGALAGFGRKTESEGRDAVVATLTFVGGGIRIGLIPIAQVLPLF